MRAIDLFLNGGEAITEYREVQRLAPDEPNRYRNLAYLLRMRGDQKEAEVVLRELLRVEPENSWATWYLGDVLSDLRRQDESRDFLKKGQLELNPNREWPYDTLARLLQEAREWDDLQALLQKGISANPESGHLRWRLGDYYF